MRIVHAILLVLAIIEITIAVFAAKSAQVTWPPMRVAGSCLLLIVIAWIVAVRLQLGGSFSVTPQARKLVTTGIYARIRNPIYVASPFLLIGLSMALMQWWPMLLSVIVIPLQIVRARREAAVRALLSARSTISIALGPGRRQPTPNHPGHTNP